MKFSKDIVVGLKFYVGPLDLTGIDTTDFVKNIGFSFTTEEDLDIPDSTGLFKGENKMQCRYFDDEEGYMHVTFDKEVHKEELVFFGEEEFIFKKIEE